MSKTFHVIYDGKVLRPEGPIDLEPNAHYVATIEHESLSGTHDLWNVFGGLTGKVEGHEDWSQSMTIICMAHPNRERIVD